MVEGADGQHFAVRPRVVAASFLGHLAASFLGHGNLPHSGVFCA